MTTYTHWDVLLASPTEPLPLKKRQYQMNLMRQALEKKKAGHGTGVQGGPAGASKVGGSQAGGGAPKMFRRKSGSA